MKEYSIFVHWKQGDDLQRCIEKAGSPHAGLEEWADDLANAAAYVAEIEQRLKGKNFDIAADTHMISFTPNDAQAEEALDAAVEAGLIIVEEVDDEEEDVFDEGELGDKEEDDDEGDKE